MKVQFPDVPEAQDTTTSSSWESPAASSRSTVYMKRAVQFQSVNSSDTIQSIPITKRDKNASLVDRLTTMATQLSSKEETDSNEGSLEGLELELEELSSQETEEIVEAPIGFMVPSLAKQKGLLNFNHLPIKRPHIFEIVITVICVLIHGALALGMYRAYAMQRFAF